MSLKSFWVEYQLAHQKCGTRVLHAIGTTVGTVFVCLGILSSKYWVCGLGVMVGYSFAWGSHLFIEKNSPLSLSNPFYSFLSDFRMVYWVIRYPFKNKKRPVRV